MLKLQIGWQSYFIGWYLIIDAYVHGECVGLVATVDGLAPGPTAIIYVIF